MKNILRDGFGLPLRESYEHSLHRTTLTGFGWSSKAMDNEESCKVDSSGNLSVWVENAGTVTRFLLPLFAFLLSDRVMSGGSRLSSVTMDGNSYMRHRPIGDLILCLLSAFVGIDVEVSS